MLWDPNQAGKIDQVNPIQKDPTANVSSYFRNLTYYCVTVTVNVSKKTSKS
jgi:hypothetical protein